jgi:hypothetical protein
MKHGTMPLIRFGIAPDSPHGWFMLTGYYRIQL